MICLQQAVELCTQRITPSAIMRCTGLVAQDCGLARAFFASHPRSPTQVVSFLPRCGSSPNEDHWGWHGKSHCCGTRVSDAREPCMTDMAKSGAATFVINSSKQAGACGQDASNRKAAWTRNDSASACDKILLPPLLAASPTWERASPHGPCCKHVSSSRRYRSGTQDAARRNVCAKPT